MVNFYFALVLFSAVATKLLLNGCCTGTQCKKHRLNSTMLHQKDLIFSYNCLHTKCLL